MERGGKKDTSKKQMIKSLYLLVNSTIEIKKNNDNFKDYNLLMRT
jgi:hypothetical protein